MVTPPQKEFCVLEFAETNAIVTVQCTFRTDSALIQPILRAFHSGLDSLKKVNACAKERILEDHMF